MKKLILVPIIITLSIVFFLFWPEVRYSITCDPNNIDPNSGCAALQTYDYSDVRLRSGITWFERQTDCRRTDPNCRPQSATEEAMYASVTPIPFVGSLILATILTGIGYFLQKHFSRKSQTPKHR